MSEINSNNNFPTVLELARAHNTLARYYKCEIEIERINDGSAYMFRRHLKRFKQYLDLIPKGVTRENIRNATGFPTDEEMKDANLTLAKYYRAEKNSRIVGESEIHISILVDLTGQIDRHERFVDYYVGLQS